MYLYSSQKCMLQHVYNHHQFLTLAFKGGANYGQLCKSIEVQATFEGQIVSSSVTVQQQGGSTMKTGQGGGQHRSYKVQHLLAGWLGGVSMYIVVKMAFLDVVGADKITKRNRFLEDISHKICGSPQLSPLPVPNDGKFSGLDYSKAYTSVVEQFEVSDRFRNGYALVETMHRYDHIKKIQILKLIFKRIFLVL